MNTEQRSTILSVLKQSGRPLTRNEILSKGRKRLPKLGSATVDRFVKQMSKDYKLVGLSFPGHPTRFELPTDKEHPHFICRACEKVFDLNIPMKIPRITLPDGFNVSGGEVVYSGTCPKCQVKI